jgi:assimilatory nitrate reductase catalytic subunit
MPVATSTPRFLQGIYLFEGQGLKNPVLLDPSLVYTVPHDAVAQLVYFRGGNATDRLVTILVMRDGEPMRYFPLGAQADTHVPLRIVEDLLADTKLEIQIAAEGTGTVVLDIGLVEIS